MATRGREERRAAWMAVGVESRVRERREEAEDARRRWLRVTEVARMPRVRDRRRNEG